MTESTNSNDEKPLLTIAEIRSRFFPDIPIHRLKYAADEYGIAMRHRAGIVRLYAENQVADFRAALERVKNRGRL